MGDGLASALGTGFSVVIGECDFMRHADEARNFLHQLVGNALAFTVRRPDHAPEHEFSDPPALRQFFLGDAFGP